MFKKVYGWGLSSFSYSKMQSLKITNFPGDAENGRGFAPRGKGRSYGDSASNSGGTCLLADEFKTIEIDSDKGVASVGAGITIRELEEASLLRGYFPYVVPGTAEITIGGAIASDIHGKSHHRVGAFSNHLIEIKLFTGYGGIKTLRPDDDETSSLFWATVGGMGLTGMIVEAKIALLRVESNQVEVNEKRVRNIDHLLETLKEFNSNYMYTVAWIDLSGKYHGRGVVSGANHCTVEQIPSHLRTKRFGYLKERTFKIFLPFKYGVMNNFTIRTFNSIWFHKPLENGFRHIQKYMHPLDSIPNWNILYGKRGFIQYQFVIPFDSEEVLKTILVTLRAAKYGSALTVLKSLGKPSNGLIGFPIKGWTLAIDLPVKDERLIQLLRDLDHIILAAGGRIYLTKDSRMSFIHLSAMYPKLEEWKKTKKQIDPKNLWQTDQGRRLKLC